jgi:hypothetical protein
MKEQIIHFISSEVFKKTLNKINLNYSNLKQESFIRNSILEYLNETFEINNNSFKAFAEHPRVNGNRIDLSIVSDDLQDQFLVEFKFQYTKDYKDLSECKGFVDRDFLRTIGVDTADLFILIVSNWDVENKRAFDRTWGINSDLSKYISSNENWVNNLSVLFSGYPDAELNQIKVTVADPYETNYHFYLLSKKRNASSPFDLLL